jgi:hypothetical protein
LIVFKLSHRDGSALNSPTTFSTPRSDRKVFFGWYIVGFILHVLAYVTDIGFSALAAAIVLSIIASTQLGFDHGLGRDQRAHGHPPFQFGHGFAAVGGIGARACHDSGGASLFQFFFFRLSVWLVAMPRVVTPRRFWLTSSP